MKIVIEGAPIPKARPKFFRRGRTLIGYDPQAEQKASVRSKMMRDYRKALDSAVKELVMEASDLTQAASFDVEMYFHINPTGKCSQGALKLKYNGKLWGLEPCNIKPDVDNLGKFYLDCANKVLYKDDGMVCFLSSRKYWSDHPRTEIYIMPHEEINLHETAKKIITTFEPQQLKELLYDMQTLSEVSIGDLEDLEGDDRQEWFLATAGLLASFIREHGDLLKKLNKYKDFEAKTNQGRLLESCDRAAFNVVEENRRKSGDRS